MPSHSLYEQPLILEEKPLPNHLRDTYLGASSTLSILISSLLFPTEEERLLRVLREHKGAIGWFLANMKAFDLQCVCIASCYRMTTNPLLKHKEMRDDSSKKMRIMIWFPQEQ